MISLNIGLLAIVSFDVRPDRGRQASTFSRAYMLPYGHFGPMLGRLNADGLLTAEVTSDAPKAISSNRWWPIVGFSTFAEFEI
jgi:hypothetical protein